MTLLVLRPIGGEGIVDMEWMIVTSLVIAAAGTTALAWSLRRRRREKQYTQARKGFHGQREYLEAKFVELASESGKPRGLKWSRCDFADDVAYARDRQSSELAAFVAVTISFEAIEGGGMEDVEAVGNLRAATAVFRFSGGRWRTDGRAIFNLNPTETIRRFRANLEMVAEDLAGHV